MTTIQPRILKGFRDILPRDCIPKHEMIRTIERVFTTFGYSPIETPALELAEILLGKGSEETDKQLFRFEDNGKRDVALRFDLTVPLARFIAQNRADITLPFRRYQIAPVWRAEKPQRGRYREFTQCDIDIIGSDSLLADAEILAALSQTLDGLQVDHVFLLNHRKILGGFLEAQGLSEQTVPILRVIDKLSKLGWDKVKDELSNSLAIGAKQIDAIYAFLSPTEFSKDPKENKFQASINAAEQLLESSPVAFQALRDLEKIAQKAEDQGTNLDKFELDFSIARGLDYYTGMVFETRFTPLPDIGSISSGGRYDNLASLYSKEQLPGVGCSIGLDRLLAAMAELGDSDRVSSKTHALITVFDEAYLGNSYKAASQLRSKGFNTEVFIERNKKIGAQLKYANRRKIPFVVIIGEEEAKSDNCTVKELASGKSEKVPLDSLHKFLTSQQQRQ